MPTFKFTRRRILGAIVAIVVSTPIAIATVTLMESEYVRWHLEEQLVRYAAHFRPPQYVFVGDSNIAAGRNWGRRMFGIRGQLSAKNLGVSGFTVEQVCTAARGAIDSGTPRVVMMCGTNDTFLRHASIDHWFRMLEEVRTVIQLAKEKGMLLIIVLPPYLGPCDEQWQTRNDALRAWHSALRFECAVTETTCIDVNPVIAPDRELLQEFSLPDRVHLNDAALDLIAEAVRETTSTKTP